MPTSRSRARRLRARTVAAGSVAAGAVAAFLLFAFGYDGPHMDRMYILTSIVAVLVGLLTACGLVARGRSKRVKVALLAGAALLSGFLLVALMMPIEVT